MKKAIVQRILVFLHCFLMIALFLGCWLLFYRQPATGGEYFVHDRTIFVCYSLVLVTLSNVYGCYKVGFSRAGELFLSQVLANILSWGITYVMLCVMAQRLVNPLAGFGAFALQCLISAVLIKIMGVVYYSMNKTKNAIIIYRNDADLRKLEEIYNFKENWKITKRIRCNVGREHDLPNDQKDESANTTDIHSLIEEMKGFDIVFVSGVNATLRNGIVKHCVESDKECYFVPHTGDVIIAGATHTRAFAVPICKTGRCKISPEYIFIKRLFDVLISLCGLVVLFPFMVGTAIAIKAYDRGPVLYKQVRLTKDGKEFKILKFRSMRVDAEKDGVARLSSGDSDDRITPVGKVIRAIRFDELPQLFNILRGDMSIVGPRPERPEIAAQYREVLPAFDLRLQVKAGLTGYAQIYGRYNTEPVDKLKMDLMYINNIGPVEDLKLLFATIRILFMKESTVGIAEGQTTAMAEQQEEKETAGVS